jgi:hypothetical protein
MAKVKIEAVVYNLESEFKKALADTMLQFAPQTEYDVNILFKYFLKRIDKHCSVWEKVPDECIQTG